MAQEEHMTESATNQSTASSTVSHDDPDFGIKMGQVVARSWADEEFKQRLLEDTEAVLAEYEIVLPKGVSYKVVENSSTTRYLILPSKPVGDEMDGSDVDVYGANSWFSGCVTN